MAPGAPRPLAELLAAIDDHPEHAMSARTVGVADADVAMAREATRPDKSIEIGYGRRSRAFGDMVSIQFSVDLPVFPRDRQDRGVAARLAQRERAIAIREDHLRVMGADITAAWSDWQGAAERLRLVIERAIATLKEKLIEEFIVVAIVCALFLMHLRSSLVAILSLSVGVLVAFLIMRAQGINANVMSLGGIAIATGAMLGAAIVMIENAHKHLERWRSEHSLPPSATERAGAGVKVSGGIERVMTAPDAAEPTSTPVPA